jgi:hypothetical protein
MSLEDQGIDRKSLRMISGKSVDWNEIAKDCVCFVGSKCAIFSKKLFNLSQKCR